MNFNSYFTIKHTSNLRILLLTLFFIVPLGTIKNKVNNKIRKLLLPEKT